MVHQLSPVSQEVIAQHASHASHVPKDKSNASHAHRVSLEQIDQRVNHVLV